MTEVADGICEGPAQLRVRGDARGDELGSDYDYEHEHEHEKRGYQMFDHERLDVYKVSLEFVAWVFERADRLRGHFRHARDELIRASQSIPRNIAEGNGKRSLADRRRFFEIARGSALECAAILDQLHMMRAFDAAETKAGKLLLHRIVSMLTKMTETVERIGEEAAEYRVIGDGQYQESGIDYEHE
jgi:four helix bundle protein